ncbi:MAG: hypothetical protein ACYS30_21375, partial [Planctomycetota bacterium]
MKPRRSVDKRNEDRGTVSVIPHIRKRSQNAPSEGGINDQKSTVNRNKALRHMRTRKQIMGARERFALTGLFPSCSDLVIFMQRTMYIWFPHNIPHISS